MPLIDVCCYCNVLSAVKEKKCGKGMEFYKQEVRIANKRNPQRNIRNPSRGRYFFPFSPPFTVFFSRILKIFLQLPLCNYGETNRKGERLAVVQSDPVIGPGTSSSPAMQEVNKARLFLTMSAPSLFFQLTHRWSLYLTVELF